MNSPNSQELGNALDLTLPEKRARPGNPVVLPPSSPAVADTDRQTFDDLQTDIRACLPWYARSADEHRASRLAQAMVAAMAVLALTGCLFFGASRAIFVWWLFATLALIWGLAIDNDRTPADLQVKGAAKESVVLGLLVIQFLSIAAIWTVFVVIRLK